MTRALEELAEVADGELVARATRAYRGLFGVALPRVERVDP